MASRLIYLCDTAGDRNLSNSSSACITPSIGEIAVRTNSTFFKVVGDQRMLIGVLTNTWVVIVWRVTLKWSAISFAGALLLFCKKTNLTLTCVLPDPSVPESK